MWVRKDKHQLIFLVNFHICFDTSSGLNISHDGIAD